ncbi:Sel1-like repeat protein [Bosea sp. LC85]|uniref:SEL1-like repeat protein n=1 Tax=Bosea sp. LC85 TaxID=1502851 RepID=UPI0004E32BF8|nr:SEL1-like repeat protein [Bosea sp. LC85]KFC75338.1 Sel1-like repeat protein [Bosea sp. LC85]
MANSLPWSVKGVDPRTRDAAKAAARRAGMTLGEWLDHKIRVEAEESGPTAAPLEQLDIAALSERLAKLSQGQMETSSQAAASAAAPQFAPEMSRSQIEAALSQAALAERMTRESSVKTAGALDSIARWIEKTENRLASGERSIAERQERATTVIADAIKTMGERIAEIERKALDAQSKAAAARPALNRDGLAAAVTDIRSRQRMLDTDSEAAPSGRTGLSESRVAALRQDLRSLSERVGAASDHPSHMSERPSPAAAPRHVETPALEKLIADLGSKLERLDRNDRIEPILRPLARIETEVARLARENSGESYARFELEIAHLAAKVDALAARGSDRAALAPVLRDIAELRELLATTSDDNRLGDLSDQVSALAGEVARLRDGQPDALSMRGLSQAIEDVRDALLTDRFGDPAPLLSLSRQVEALADKVGSLPVMRPEVITSQTEQLFARLNEIGASGSPASNELSRRIEALIIKLEDVSDRQPNQLADRIDSLQHQIETLADHGPAAVTRQIEGLAARIESLAASSNLTQMVHDGGNVQVARVDMRPVEDMLRSLAEKIDEAGRPGAESDSFDALEQQIAGLASRLDEAVATRSAETGIERTLQDLVRHLQTVREDTAAAAERAARTAMADMASKAPAQAGGFAELSTLVSGLRESNAASGRETQDAIGAVHQTLETIISRLASLEAELGLERKEVALTPAPARPSTTPPARGLALPASMSAAIEDRFGARLETRPTERAAEAPAARSHDLPLEPGSGRPRPDAPTAPAATAQDPQSVRQNLIAAARRSAKAASEAAASAPAAEAERGGTSTSKGGKLKEIMEKRRRPLLLGLAAVVLAMGTAHVVTGALQGPKTKAAGNETVQSPASAPALAAPEPALPEAPAKPAKDQNSVLSPVELGPATAFAGPAAPSLGSPETTSSTTQPAATAALPPAAAPDPVQAVTGLGDLPAGFGTPGLRKAALAGDARAVYELANRAADGSNATRDPKLALRLFERAAVAGLAPAQFRLANMFEKGVGTQRDIALARVWYSRAAERGNSKAMHNLAVLYAEGVDGKADYATATEWFRRAADAGVRDSQYNLAVLLGRGLGVSADLGQSYLWFAIAAKQGDDDAARKRDEVAGRLNANDLAAAKLAVDSWKAKVLEPSANEVAAPTQGWEDNTSAAVRKPAKPARS